MKEMITKEYKQLKNKQLKYNKPCQMLGSLRNNSKKNTFEGDC